MNDLISIKFDEGIKKGSFWAQKTESSESRIPNEIIRLLPGLLSKIP